jgi:hypothetical protein
MTWVIGYLCASVVGAGLVLWSDWTTPPKAGDVPVFVTATIVLAFWPAVLALLLILRADELYLAAKRRRHARYESDPKAEDFYR